MRKTERDVELLWWTGRLKYLFTSLIAQFFFGGSAKSARRRLKALSDSGYLCCFDRQGTFSCGRAERAYFLNKKKREEITHLVGSGNVSFYSLPKNLALAEHTMEIARVLLSIKQFCSIHNDYSFQFLVEHETSLQNMTNCLFGQDKNFFIPDFLVVITNSSGNKALFFGEIDLSTETLSSNSGDKVSISGKLKAYIEYFDRQGYVALSEQFDYPFKGFRVLFVVNSENRMQRIATLCESEGTRGMVWLTTQDRIVPESFLFDPIWQVPCSGKKEPQAITKKHRIK